MGIVLGQQNVAGQGVGNPAGSEEDHSRVAVAVDAEVGARDVPMTSYIERYDTLNYSDVESRTMPECGTLCD